MGPLRQPLSVLRAVFAAFFLLWTSSGAAQSPSVATAPLDAASKEVPVGFSRLLVRLEGTDEIGIASADFRVHLLERMRTQGFAAVGAEDVVFGKDESNRAAYLVGGTVKELTCRRGSSDWSCRIGVEWEVFDVTRDQVVYTYTARTAVLALPLDRRDRMGGMLVDLAMDRLLARAAFRRALVPHDDASEAATSFPAAKLPRCAPGARVAANAEDLLNRVVVLKTRRGFGSGFFVSPEGLVLTAAHVVEGNRVTLRTHDGAELKAVPVRIDTRNDVALLRTEPPLSGARCMPLRADTAAGGAEVYAVGAPASLALAFSLTRGIVSGYPTVAGRRLLQTDAPVSPGNSGGPIVDDKGVALGVVSFKVVEQRVEGLAFAVPMPEALEALNLHVGDATDPSLLTGSANVAESPTAHAFTDTPDAVPSLDPQRDWARAMAAEGEDARDRPQGRSRRGHGTPGGILALRWGGLAVGSLGVLSIVATYVGYDASRTTQSQFDTLQTWNTVGWVSAVAGAGAFVLSFVVQPSASKQSSLRIDPTGVRWEGAF
jgi:S1-C subfamily serine protease